jgi:hypothetical protein
MAKANAQPAVDLPNTRLYLGYVRLPVVRDGLCNPSLTTENAFTETGYIVKVAEELLLLHFS